MQKMVLFGAGKIGRSFIAQLFSRSGYEVVFADINKTVIEALNRERKYRVLIRADQGNGHITVENVRGVLATDRQHVIREITGADILAVSVGPAALPKITPLLAEGLLHRYEHAPGTPIDIILAENLREAAAFVRQDLMKYLPVTFPVKEYIGLVETSIGKMVPIMPEEVAKKDPLLVYAEPYNTLILDRKGFVRTPPEVEGLALKENMAAWVDRKSFIHNLGHVAAAYYGHSCYPELTYMYEIMAKKEVYDFAKETMQQAAAVLMRHYPGEFEKIDLDDHIDDLLKRFANKALGDTVFRVGQDLYRKLGPEDRIAGVLKLAAKYELPYDKILLTLKYGMNFRSTDLSGKRSEKDIRFSEMIDIKGMRYALKEVCNIDEKKYPGIYRDIGI